MREPILVVMAAGMGSRYGGMKQIDPVGPNGEIIMDYSVFDAKRAGFKKVIFVIKKEKEQEFREVVGDRVSRSIEVAYAFQDLNDVPAGFELPERRVKPWGTGHAVYAARDLVNAPFAVINADDFYGYEAFKEMYNYLKDVKDEKIHRLAMVGFILQNTLTENGTVARGICKVNDGYLESITERTKIQRRNGVVQYTEDANTWYDLDEDSICSMNLFGFTACMMSELEIAFIKFLENLGSEDPLKSEFFLPSVVNDLLGTGQASVRVLQSSDMWYGMTYKEDKENVCKAIEGMIAEGRYPESLWS